MSRAARFVLVTPHGSEPVKDALSPETVLSKALSLASGDDAGGEWLVREYEDTVYRITREPGARGRTLVETGRRS